jgi:hypothetical protein
MADRNSAPGGRINHVGAAGDFSKVYAVSEWGGLYQSFDQGNAWVKIQTFSPAATCDVKVDPRDTAFPDFLTRRVLRRTIRTSVALQASYALDVLILDRRHGIHERMPRQWWAW